MIVEVMDEDPNRDTDSNIKFFSLTNPEISETLLTAEDKEELKLRSWEISPDGAFLLFQTALNYEPQPIFRHSEKANYAVYHFESG